MKKTARILLTGFLVWTLLGCAAPAEPTPADVQEANSMQIKLTVADTEWTVTLAENASAAALLKLLESGPLTVAMRDYAGMEKVGPIGRDLPRSDEQITTGPGDLILYQGNALVIYYAPNAWNFSRLGKIDDVAQEELVSVLGSGDVEVTLSLMNEKGE